MFTGIDIIVIVIVVMFILYLANPDAKAPKIEADPLMVLVVLVTIAMFLLTL